jgi:hypothetical protein
VDQGANWILDHLGISPTVIQTLQDFNPDVANRAWGQVKYNLLIICCICVKITPLIRSYFCDKGRGNNMATTWE